MENKLIKLSEIRTDLPLEGYIWMSNSQYPLVLDGRCVEAQDLCGKNPFVVEANLYARTGKISYYVRYVDGVHYVHCYSLTEDDIGKYATQVFHSVRMGNRELCFLDIWEEVADEACLGMNVLQPATQVFIGFK